tara:strand:+ start:399 stop:650 length:252 start_codon:yes stop_codon:yes gene_type:complete
MTYEAKSEIEDKVIAMFLKAVASPENKDINEVDGINWNFVDADMHIDVQQAGLELHFDLADFVEGLIEELLEFGEVELNTEAA